MTDKEKQQALDELLPNKKSIEINNKYLSYRPLIIFIVVVVALFLYFC